MLASKRGQALTGTDFEQDLGAFGQQRLQAIAEPDRLP